MDDHLLWPSDAATQICCGTSFHRAGSAWFVPKACSHVSRAPAASTCRSLDSGCPAFEGDKSAETPKISALSTVDPTLLRQAPTHASSARWSVSKRVTVHVLGIAAGLSGLSTACDSKVVIGSWSCQDVFTSSGRTQAAVDASSSSFAVPWSTGFEEGFCEYAEVGGYCYSHGVATYTVVDSPVHSGRRAAAFSVIADGTQVSSETRCVREGNLPMSAYYGAWYLIPAVTTSSNNWNLFHFQGGDSASAVFHGLWDISLYNRQGGGLGLSMYDFLRDHWYYAAAAPPLPVGSWFHLEVYLKRAPDTSGEITVYQDGSDVLHLTGLATDDSQWCQWYLGNLAIQLESTDSTLFVDDISVRATR